jgi:DNA polymerase-3 subunit alpha
MPLQKLQIDKIPLDDQKTWNLICSGNTRGCFQLESPLGRHWCKMVKPRSIKELSDVISLIRPSCLEAFSGDPPKNLTRHYSDRKNGLEEDTETHPALKEILKDTHGIMVYQENSMFIASKLAGFSETEADTLRKGVGKKLPEVIAKLEDIFISGCKKVGILNEEQAKEVFEWIRAGARYQFCKAHATSYVLGYRTAYCKTHYPVRFYTAYLTGANWKQDTRKEIKELVEDAKKNEVVIKTPDLRDLKDHFYILLDKNDQEYIRFGIGDIKDVGGSALKKIKINITKLDTWFEYIIKFSDKVSTTVNTALISSGSLDYFKIPRIKMLFELDLWNQLTEKEKEYIIGLSPNKLKNELNPNEMENALNVCFSCGCKNVKRREIVSGLIKLYKNPPYSLEDKIEQIVFMEEKYLGAALTYSRLDASKEAPNANLTCAEIVEGKGRKNILIAVEITRVKEIVCKSGEKMAFLEASDNTGTCSELVIFADAWKEYKDILYVGNLVMLHGYRGKKGLVIHRSWQI